MVKAVLTSCILAFQLIQAPPLLADEAEPVLLLRWGAFGHGPGQFENALGLGLDAAGNVYVADTGNNRIQEFTGSGVFITQFGSLGTGNGLFNTPTDCALDPTGTVFVSDAGNHLIQVFGNNHAFQRQWTTRTVHTAVDPSSEFVYVAVDDSIFKFNASNGSRITAWQFTEPPAPDGAGFAVGLSGRVYIAGVRGDYVRSFAADGVLLHEWGGSGTQDGLFHGAQAVATDQDESVYVTDASGRIQKFTSDGVFLLSFGSATLSPRLIDIAIDQTGSIFVLDQYASQVVKFGDKVTPTRGGTWGRLKLLYR
jgi:DNA-binding beta-propeller fold protein YncE